MVCVCICVCVWSVTDTSAHSQLLCDEFDQKTQRREALDERLKRIRQQQGVTAVSGADRLSRVSEESGLLKEQPRLLDLWIHFDPRTSTI